MQVGTLDEIHRYPVKSMLGETLAEARVGELGIPGDRAWAIRDEQRGGIQGGKKLPGLMGCAARYLEPPGSGPAPAPEISLPDGARFLASDPDAAQRIGAAIGRELTLWPIVPAENLEHYRRSAPDHPDLQQELRAIFGREPGEPLPDIGRLPPEILVNASPPGTYFDAFPLLLLSARPPTGTSTCYVSVATCCSTLPTAPPIPSRTGSAARCASARPDSRSRSGVRAA